MKWWTRVTALSQLSFIWQAKDTTPSRHEGGPIPKDVKRIIWLNFGSAFYVFFPPPPEPVLCKLGWPKSRMLVSPEVLTPVHGLSLAPLSRAFLLFVF